MKILIIIKFTVVIVCSSLFLALMRDVWNKFESKITITGVQFRSEEITEKKLPHMTICPWPKFKKPGMLLNKIDCGK